MKFRSFNEELLISTALLVNVFNDIVIDRRSHGLKRDYSRPISLDEIVQKKIEIPCIVGDRSNILRSLENEQGKYKLPLIILQNKSIKTDALRMVDLHADVFYQVDDRFSDLNPEDPLYRPQQLGKRRGQPIIMDFDMTIITRYKEDMDQILSNWIVHFRPDVYVKWWHPRVKTTPLTSQILWNHNIGFESPVEYQITNVFTYKSSTSFSFKTWLFPGTNFIEQDTINEPLIKHIKFYPNKSDVWDEEDIERGYKDSNDGDLNWLFGDLEEEPTYEEPQNNENDELNNYEEQTQPSNTGTQTQPSNQSSGSSTQPSNQSSGNSTQPSNTGTQTQPSNQSSGSSTQPSNQSSGSSTQPSNQSSGSSTQPSNTGTQTQSSNQSSNIGSNTSPRPNNPSSWTNQNNSNSEQNQQNQQQQNNDDEQQNEQPIMNKEFEDKDEGQLAFWGLRSDQKFEYQGNDIEGLKAGKYMVNNVYAKNYAAISGDPFISQIHTNPLFGDIFRKSDRLSLISKQWQKYQDYLYNENLDNDGNAFINNVYYKGGFAQEFLKMNPPSGDYLFNRFSRTYIKNKGTADEKTISAEFGDSLKYMSPLKLNYDILSKDLILSTEYHDARINVTASSIYNSQKGIIQDFDLTSNPFFGKVIKIHLGHSVDKNFKDLNNKSIKELKNVSLFNTRGIRYEVQFKIQDNETKRVLNKIMNFINIYKNIIELREVAEDKFEMIIEDSKAGKILQDKDLKDVNFRIFTMPHQEIFNGYYYQILLNKYVYLVLKQSSTNENDVDIYDFGPLVPLTFTYLHAPVYEITIPESKLLLGLGFYMGI